MKKFIPTPVRSVPRKAESFSPWPGESIEGQTKQLMDRLLPSTTLSFISALEWACPEGWRLRHRVIGNDMWFCIASGQYSCQCDNMPRPAILGKDDVFFVPRNCVHTIERVGGKCTMCSVHFNANCLGSLPLCSLLGMQGVYGKDDGAFLKLSQYLCREFARQAAGWEQYARSGVWQVLRDLFHNHAAQFAPAVKEENFLLHARLQPVLEHIEQHLDTPSLPVQELADLVGISTVTLRKWFAQAFDQSPVHYMRSRKMSKACDLLMNSEMSIKQIAGACGYSDIPFFYRVFKKEIKVAPAEFRSGARPV